jgi:KUP system potassium uptake protein
MKKIIETLGLVFGDIGTSPIYTLTVVALLTKPDAEHILGVLSLIVWTLMILVSIQYAWLAMSLSHKGEGGDIVLREILLPLLRKGKAARVVTLLSYVSISLMMGDGVITPAISILSAVEGAKLIPLFSGLGKNGVVAISLLIATLLFAIQRRGTEKVANAFGPIMVAWFITLAFSGAASIVTAPGVLMALNPWHAVSFLSHSGLAGFVILSEVILCATGGEALYANMGQIGAAPIIRGWYIVLGALLLNYMGQGAYLIAHPGSGNILFGMVMSQAPMLYIPFLFLCIMATVIASQAMISGIFAIVFQGITTGTLPKMRVDFTSPTLRTQIYIGFVNWALFAAVAFIMLFFGESASLAAAYGLAVAGAMTITGTFMTVIFSLHGQKWKALAAAAITLVDLTFLVACSTKIPHGGYWSLIIASMPLAAILIYTTGQKRLYFALRPAPGMAFLDQYDKLYRAKAKIDGTALYFLRDVQAIPPYIMHTMFVNHIVYEDNIFISIKTLDTPYGHKSGFTEDLGPGLRMFEIELGYQEALDMEAVLRAAGIRERAIFYGIEDIVTRNPIWEIFSVIKKLSPAYVQFYKLPSNKLHGVITRVEM